MEQSVTLQNTRCNSLLFFLIICLVVPLQAGDPPVHQRLLYEANLTSGRNNAMGVIINHNGLFTDRGWTAQDGQGQLRIDLKEYLPYEATVEITIANLDPYTQMAGFKDRIAWTPFSLWSRPEFGYASLWKTAASFFYFLTEKNIKYNDQGKSNWKVISSAYYGYGAYNNLDYGDFTKSEPDAGQAMKYDIAKEYTFKLVCSNGKVWMLINDTVFKEHDFVGQLEGFNHIVIGANEMGVSILGPLFKNLRIYIPESPVSFQNVIQSSGLALDKVSGAGSPAWTDVNGDGTEDVFIPFMKTLPANEASRLYLQNADHVFTEAAVTHGLPDLRNVTQALFCDLNRDSYPDLLLVKDNRLVFYRNNKQAIFSDQTAASSLSLTLGSVVTQIIHFDCDGDADQDLLVVATPRPMLFINNGRGQFSTADNGIASSITSAIDGAAAGDLNLDGATDLVILPNDQAPLLLINNKKGIFKAESKTRGFSETFYRGFPLLVDHDRDGDLDLFILKKQMEIVNYYQNNGAAYFTDQTAALNIDKAPLLLPLDANNDGYGDYWRFVPNSANNSNTPHSHIALNQNGSSFINLFSSGSEANYAPLSSTGGVDYDQDGRMDIFAVSQGAYRTEVNEIYGRSALYRNVTTNQNHYLQIVLTDSTGGPLCTDAAVFVYQTGKIGDKSGLLGYQDAASTADGASAVLHFGLANNSQCDVLVRFATGAIVQKHNVQADRRIVILRPFQQQGPAALIRLSPETATGRANDWAQDSLAVQVLDNLNHAVAGHSVVFSIQTGNGTLNDGSVQKTILTDREGVSRAAWRFGPGSGSEQRVAVTALAANQIPLDGAPVIFKSLVLPAADTTLTLLAGNGQTGVPGVSLADSIVVQASDHFGNPHAGMAIVFSIASGGGIVNNSSRVVIYTNGQGRAAASWTLGPALGADSQSLAVQTFSGQPNPLLVTAGTIFGYPDVAKSMVQVSAPAIADGKTKVTVTVTIVDNQGNPVVGEQATIQSSLEGVIITQPVQRTDGTGMAAGSLCSKKAGSYALQIYLPSRDLYIHAATAAVFNPGPVKFLVVVSGNHQIGNRSTELPAAIVVQATDSLANPIQNAVVNFEAAFNCGQVQPSSIKTDVKGHAQVKWTLGNVLGRQTMLAAVNDRVGAVLDATAMVTNITMQPIKGNGQVTLTGAFFSDSLSVLIQEGGKTPLAGIPVTFSINKGDAIITTSGAVQTNHSGLAGIRLSAGLKTGPVNVVAAAGDTHRVTFNLGVTSTLVDSLLAVTPTAVTAQAAATQTIRVRASDRQKKSIAHVPVFFTTDNPLLNISTLAPVYTNSDGLADLTVTLPNQLGQYRVQAANGYMKGSPILFTIQTVPDNPESMSIYDGEDQSGYAQQWLTKSLKVKVTDAAGMAASGVQVRFTVHSGGGSLLDEGAATTNAAGIASTLWKLGKSGAQIVSASCHTLPGQAVQFHAVLLYNAAPIIRVTRDTTITEMQTLSMTVYAADPEGDLYTLTAQDLPLGAEFISARFSWTPTREQQGNYTIRFMAAPVLGDTTVVESRVHVLNSNRAPVLRPQPDSSNLVLRYYRVYHFSGQASDADHDSLSFKWLMNGRLLSTDEQLDLMANPTIGAVIKLELVVSDGQDSVNHAWQLQISSAVENSNLGLLPKATRLAQNYPNPFNPSTTIYFESGETQEIKLEIVDLSGRLVKTVFYQQIAPGAYHAQWDGRNESGDTVPSGVYFCILTGRAVRQAIKVTMVK